MELIVIFVLATVCLFLVFFPTIVFFAYSFLVLLPLVLFFWLYLNYFYEILPVDLVTTLILFSVLLILFPFLLFSDNCNYRWITHNQKLKNHQNHAFLLLKLPSELLGNAITYRKFLFFFLLIGKYFTVACNGLCLPLFSLYVTITFLDNRENV